MVVLLVFLLLTRLLFRGCFCRVLVPRSTLATASLFTNRHLNSKGRKRLNQTASGSAISELLKSTAHRVVRWRSKNSRFAPAPVLPRSKPNMRRAADCRVLPRRAAARRRDLGANPSGSRYFSCWATQNAEKAMFDTAVEWSLPQDLSVALRLAQKRR
jgi:hypothetical protein